ncbi:MAG: hypothetical protein DME91_02890 [Verrucomicrobia bacterium]|nr:MAG: hypothetical protein DME91_02890 [Verrucomicrobiota bacterium]
MSKNYEIRMTNDEGMTKSGLAQGEPSDLLQNLENGQKVNDEIEVPGDEGRTKREFIRQSSFV